jgi:amino acid transporter
MNNFSNLFKKENIGELILGILFVIYLIMGYQTPQPLANLFDSLVGKIIIFIIIVSMFMYTSPVLAILALFVAFDLIRRSSYAINKGIAQKYYPSEKHKMSQFTALNQFPYTLEQEVVKKMAPIIQSGSVLTKASYKPLLENLYDASPVNSS